MKAWQKLAVAISSLSFLALMIFPMMSSVNQSPSSNEQTASTDSTAGKQLEAQAQGYEAVLKREPNNSTALQGLLGARLQLIELEKKRLQELEQKAIATGEVNPQDLQQQRLKAIKLIQEQSTAVTQQSEKVLEKEPNHPIALQGLVEARLQLGDLQGAIAPMEKLVALYPEQEQLSNILKRMKSDLQKAKNPSAQPPNPDNKQN
ncbi:hypothetical protein PCC8801_1228 [Rippkaea orientalis PCC 8801]|uniref:TPR repeat-containing protein n=1 Tax=Rippkaea orientalis (strain PCC 8801 / RF-1) TaxID=41431 RepID=B7K3F2_RIPO1|nr:hypothetical protein [Rippkaea orientalis]ACK65294.1 hypothetical protein PCC8801_1228 [Rippkaea orientalis PCC 8801]